MLKDILHQAEDKMNKAVDACRRELVKIRTGKATTGLLDAVKVDYYGTPTPINQVGNLSVLDPHTLAITPWDRTAIVAIEKAIRSADLGLNPGNDGAVIRIPIPPLNEERRRELVKLVKKFGEEGKISLRNIRRDAIDHLKKAEKDEHASEDERKVAEKKVQEMTDKHTKDVEQLLADKEKEIMEV
jgi:ribosome recycling factor